MTTPSPVQWAAVGETLRALARLTGAGGFQHFARFATAATDPLRRLDRLALLVRQALAGDAHAAERVHAMTDILHVLAPLPGGAAGRLLADPEDDTSGCICSPINPWPRGVPERAAQVWAVPFSDVLDERALVTLMVALAALDVRQVPQKGGHALGGLVALAAASDILGRLSRALRTGGLDGLHACLEEFSARGLLHRMQPPASPMRTFGGPGPADLPMPSLPGDDLAPNLPGVPPLEELLARIKGWKRPDPDIWDIPFIWWRDPVQYFPPGWLGHLACTREAFARLQARRAILSPPRPTRVTWTDGIIRIEAGGACAGDRIVVHGSGFNAIRATAVLLVPFAEGCRPVVVAPPDWTDKRITFVLPVDAISGPIGFGDRAYIALYDAWAADQNRLADEIRALPCGALVGAIELVPPFRECPPDIGVNHLRAGVPIIDAFVVQGAAADAVEPGDTALLTWSVRNAEHVRVERVSATGPLLAGTTTLLDPSTDNILLGPFAFLAPSLFTYRLTVVGPCGSATKDVTIHGSKRPRLWVSGAEVTQGIQTLAGTVRLVERKPTVVRVTVQHGLAGFGGNAVPNVLGRIRVRRSDGVLSGWWDAANGSSPMAPTPGASITVQASPQRNNTNDTLNFLIPPAWSVGQVAFEIEVRTNGFGAVGAFAGFDGLARFTTGSVAFLPRRMLEFRYVRINWGGSTPTDAICTATLASAVPLLPTPAANVATLPGVGVQTPAGTGDDDRQDLLDDFDDRHNCSTWEALTEWLGSDCPDEDGTIWVLIPGVFYRGQAYDIPSNVCFTPPSDGPYAAHEISHCLDQEHVGVMCSNGQQAQGGDPPSDWPNNAQLVDVPFDVTRNVALTLAGSGPPGPGVFDVMTYCGTPNNTWPMPARWDRLWDQVGA